MGGVAVNAFQPVAPAAHQPRITIDRFVLSREQWIFQVADSGWAFAKDEQERYYLARRWRHDHHLPERVFFRVPVELKPMAADFRSIVLVNLFAKHIRQTQAAGHAEYTVTEMLPDLGQLWLTDRAGPALQLRAEDHRLRRHDRGSPAAGTGRNPSCRSCLTVAMSKMRVRGRACQAPAQEAYLERVS